MNKKIEDLTLKECLAMLRELTILLDKAEENERNNKKNERKLKGETKMENAKKEIEEEFGEELTDDELNSIMEKFEDEVYIKTREEN